MAIVYKEKTGIFTLQTVNTTYQMKVDEHGILLHLYYGDKLQWDMDYTVLYEARGFSGTFYELGNDRSYSMDTLPREYPTAGTGDFRSSALVIRNEDGSECCDLRYISLEIKKGKYELSGLPAVYASEEEAETLSILLEDTVSKVQVQLLYGVLEQKDIITRSVIIINQSKSKVIVEKAASASLDFVHGKYDLISFYGRPTMERNFQRTEIVHTNQVIGSRRGTSSHQYNPAVIIAEKDATENAGNCYGMLFVYSGNFMFEAEKDPIGMTRAIMGLQSDLFHYPLEAGEQLVVPETILTYSKHGFADLSHNYHRCIRNHIIRGNYQDKTRPILINSWEAAYFNINGETIYKLAQEAAELGIDLVVMDDGWFGKRDSDHSGLGDWVVNEEKLGCTLEELISKINGLGVKFGIWIEPEMISEDSDLYRAHPDWAMKLPGRNPILSRNQLVLDFTRKEVRDAVFEQICTVLDKGNIEYVKWDMNRSIDDVYSVVNEQGRVTYDFVLGVYDFAEKLIRRYPHMLVEGCSGGGGRFDAGMLYYTPQIWCSDNTDAINRTRIQYGTSFFYPISSIGAHVTEVPNHLTNRVTSMKTRGVVAMAGTFGYEMNPAKLSEDEKEEIREQIKQYKKFARLIHTGNYYRLSNPLQDEYAAWQFVSEDCGQVLLNVVKLEFLGHNQLNYVKLKGLKPDAIYKDIQTGKCYSGAALMNAGIPLPTQMEMYEAYQALFVR